MKKYALLVVGLLAVLSVDIGYNIRINGQEATVTRGPDWLAGLLYHPPDWLIPAAIFISIIIVGIAYVGYQRTDFSTDVKLEMAANVLTIVFAGIAITAFNNLAVPYLLSVPVAGIGGYLTAVYVVKELHTTMDTKTPG